MVEEGKRSKGVETGMQQQPSVIHIQLGEGVEGT
jgi:hypothetical protein